MPEHDGKRVGARSRHLLLVVDDMPKLRLLGGATTDERALPETGSVMAPMAVAPELRARNPLASRQTACGITTKTC